MKENKIPVFRSHQDVMGWLEKELEKHGITQKPPIGLKPKYIHDSERFQEVCLAIARYYKKSFPIPVEWIEEYNQLVTQEMDKDSVLNKKKLQTDRYPMTKDQPAQIDCRVLECKFNAGSGKCSNVSPAITLNDNNKFVCWSKEI